MPTQRAGPVRPDDIRQHNLSLVLSHVHRDGALTRAELTSHVVGPRPFGRGGGDGARVGRPSHVVAPNAHGPYAVAVDIDVAHVTVAAVGLGGVISAREVVPTGSRPSRPERLVELIRRSISLTAAGEPGEA